MGLAAEVNGFVNAYTKMSAARINQQNSSARNNYYKALITNSDRNFQMSQQRLDQQASQFRQSLGVRQQQFNQQQNYQNNEMGERARHNKAMESIYGNRTNQRQDPYSAPTLQPGDNPNYYPGNQPNAPAPTTTAGEDDDQQALNSNEVTHVDTAPGTSYDRDTAIDGDNPPMFAQGGAVGDQQDTDEERAAANAQRAAAPPAVGDDEDEGGEGPTAAAPAPAPKPKRASPKASRPKGAINDYTSSGDTADQTAANGGTTDAKSGFSLSTALNSWEKPPQQPAAQQGAPAVGAGAQQMPPVQGLDNGSPAPQQAAPAVGGDQSNKGDGGANSDDENGGVDRMPDNPVAIGLKQIMKAYGLDQQGAVGGQNQQGVQQMHAAPNAMSEQEVHAIDNGVDPNNELNASSKTVARLDATVRYWLANNNPRNAAVIAQRLLEYGKQKTQVLGQAAVQAIKTGNMQRATQLLDQAYSYIPDGGKLDAKVNKDGSVSASVLDERTGFTMDLGTMQPQQLYHYSLGVANGTEYMQHLVQIASGNIGPKARTAAPGAQPGGQEAPPKGPSLRDRSTASTMMQNGMPAGTTPDTINQKYGVPADNADAISGVAQRLLTGNQMTPAEAQDLAARSTDPRQSGNQFHQNDDGSVSTVYGGRLINVPRDAFLQIATMRGQRVAAQKKADQTTAKIATDQKRVDAARVASDADVNQRERARAKQRDTAATAPQPNLVPDDQDDQAAGP